MQRDNFCRPCRSAYGKAHYAENKARYIENAAAVKRRTRLVRTKYLLEFFASHPCVDCAESDPVVLEFDHLRDKSFEIAAQFEARRWEDVLEEMKKCDVVCSNCHRRRTARRRHSLRWRLTRDENPDEEAA